MDRNWVKYLEISLLKATSLPLFLLQPLPSPLTEDPQIQNFLAAQLKVKLGALQRHSRWIWYETSYMQSESLRANYSSAMSL